MSYTYISGEVEKKIQEKLDIIINSIRREISSVLSIILAGSFGYGEGVVKIENNQVYPFNDFDVYVVAAKKISKNKFDDIASKVARSIGLSGINYFYSFSKEEQKLKNNFYIDLKCFTPNELKNLLPRLRYYRFKETTQVLWGKDLRNLIPEFQINEIPAGEDIKILLDRMSQLIEYYSDDANKYCPDYLTYIIQQAYAACVTSLLISVGKFVPRYSQANNIFCREYKNMELSARMPDLIERISKFIEWRKNIGKLPMENFQEAWRICAKDIIEVIKYRIFQITNFKISSINELSEAILKMSKYYHGSYLKSIIERKFNVKVEKSINSLYYLLAWPLNLFLKVKYLRRVKKQSGKYYLRLLIDPAFPDLRIYSIGPYMLASKFDHTVDEDMLALAKKNLRKIYPCQGKTWDEISIDYANAYIAFFLQKMI